MNYFLLFLSTAHDLFNFSMLVAINLEILTGSSDIRTSIQVGVSESQVNDVQKRVASTISTPSSLSSVSHTVTVGTTNGIVFQDTTLESPAPTLSTVELTGLTRGSPYTAPASTSTLETPLSSSLSSTTLSTYSPASPHSSSTASTSSISSPSLNEPQNTKTISQFAATWTISVTDSAETATATSTEPHTAAPYPQATNSDHTASIAAGAAIGVFAVLLISILLTWRIRRKRASQRVSDPVAVTAAQIQHTPGSSSLMVDSEEEKRPTSPDCNSPQSPRSAIFPNIEERRSLDEVKDSFIEPVNELFEKIRSHINKYYYIDSNFLWESLSSYQRENLHILITPYAPPASEFPNGPTTPLLKHCLAQAVISRIDFHGDLDNIHGGRPLLPRSIFNAYRIKHSTRRAPFLQQHKADNPDFSDQQDNRADGLADACSLALEPWASNDELVPRTREDDLRVLVIYAQGLGLRLFEAQETLKWDWDGPNDKDCEGVIVTQPRLLMKVNWRGESSTMSSGSKFGGQKQGRWEEVVRARVEGY